VSTPPAQPKIYHIVNVDRLASIIADGALWCDAAIVRRPPVGTGIGMSNIKQRRLTSKLRSRPGLHVGDCVPFYFCPRSVMLYLIHQANHPGLTYHGGQNPILHLEADLYTAVGWAQGQNRRWAFTLSNAGSYDFEDRSDPAQLGEIDWQAVEANRWSGDGVDRSVGRGKMAEFLVEQHFPWHLVERVGVRSMDIKTQVDTALRPTAHCPRVDIIPDWYY